MGVGEDGGFYGEFDLGVLCGVGLPDGSGGVLCVGGWGEGEAAGFEAGSGVVEFSGGSCDLSEDDEALWVLVGFDDAGEVFGELCF